MLMAVVVAVTGAFAFNTHKYVLTGEQFTFESAVYTVDGTTISFPEGAAIDITGQREGFEFRCATPITLCYFELTASSVVTTTNGVTTITNVIVHNTGKYTPIP